MRGLTFWREGKGAKEPRKLGLTGEQANEKEDEGGEQVSYG